VISKLKETSGTRM